MKGQGRQYAEFIHRVDSVHVIGGVGFGIAVLLRFLESLPKIGVIVGHAGENVVGRTVDYAAERAHIIGHQLRHQRPDYRNAPTNAGFKQQVDLAASSQSQQVGTMLGHHFLIGGDHVLAGG